MAYNFPGVPATAMPPMGMGPIGPLGPIAGPQSFMELAGQGFPPLPPPPIPLPGMNDSPLEFSTNKNQPPVVRETSDDSSDRRSDKNDNRRDRENRDSREARDNNRRSRGERSDRRDRDRDRREERNDRDRRDDRRVEERNNANSSKNNSNHANNSNNNEVLSSTNTNSTPNIGTQMEPAAGVWGMGVGYPMMGMGPMGPMAPMMGEMTLGPHMSHTHGYNPMGMGMMSHDGSMIGAQILGAEQIMTDAAQIMTASLPPPPMTPQGTKEIIHCKSCVLFPPNPNAPPPTTRERPPGCRTIFVGGLPENITEAIIQEIFERCGEITTLRLSKKNFCHIRFVLEASVDAAIYLSGYRVRIGSSGEPANTGRLHVDFAQARDDQYEWECRQRQLQREQRHRERVEKERQRPPSSPPPVVHYTDHEASNICEKIKQDDTFMKAVQIVVTWLERGDCIKRNANIFYSMIQSTNSHVRRLLTEKAAYEEELQKAKELMKGRMQGLLIQFSQIERVFTAASHKKVWDHFTKAQRKNIEMWKKQSSEIKAVQLEDSLIEGEGEMDVSDSEEEPQRKKTRSQLDGNQEDVERLQSLKEENDSLRCQLEAYKNEVDLLKSETKTELEGKEKQMKMLQQTLKGMQEQLMQSRKQQAQDDQKIKDLTIKLNATKKEEPRESEIITLDKDDDISEEPRTPKQHILTSSFVQVTQKDAKLIGLIATFLHIHPFGASVDYLWSYLQKMEPGIKPNEVEVLMQRFPQVFKQELFGIGANMERRWQFSDIASMIGLGMDFEDDFFFEEDKIFQSLNGSTLNKASIALITVPSASMELHQLIMMEDRMGMTITSGNIIIQKDTSNLIGISIGGGAPLCPCLYIVQIFDNTPVALDGTLQAGDELVAVNGASVKGKSKVEVAKMIQSCDSQVSINYNKLHADPKQGRTLDIALKKVKHRLVEGMDSATADALGLSRAILCNDALVQRLMMLKRTENFYRGLVTHAKATLHAFFDLTQIYKVFGDAFAAIGVREPQPRASEAFRQFGEQHRQMEKFGVIMLNTLKPILSDLGTYLNKAIPDTRLTISKYADAKFEYLSYCLKVKELDDEEQSCAALQEPLYRVETGNYEYRLVLRCRQEARARFAKLRSDVLVKLELLDNKHVQDVVWQLHKFAAGLAKYYANTRDLLSTVTLFPVEVDLSHSAFQYKSIGPQTLTDLSEDIEEYESEEKQQNIDEQLLIDTSNFPDSTNNT